MVAGAASEMGAPQKKVLEISPAISKRMDRDLASFAGDAGAESADNSDSERPAKDNTLLVFGAMASVVVGKAHVLSAIAKMQKLVPKGSNQLYL